MDLIIGAGITGLSFASMKIDSDFLVVEKDKEIGGFCKTVKQDGFVWDYSGHFFHFRNKDIENYLMQNLDASQILTVQKRSQILYHGNYIDFPFQKNIHQLPKEEFIDCLYDLFQANPGTQNTFKEMLYAKFGKSIAEKFLIPYNEKLYACDLDTLDANAMGRFFPYANRDEIIANFRSREGNQSYNSTFIYPRGGAIEFINSVHKRINAANLSLDEELIHIDRSSKTALTSKRTIRYDRIISTIPFPYLLGILGIPFDRDLFTWNKVLVFNLGFDKKGSDRSNHWVYFPEKRFSFYRVGYYDNIFSDNRMSLYVELGFKNDQKIDVAYYLDVVLSDLKAAGIIEDQILVSHHSVIMNPAYVHINRSSEEYVRKLKSDLSVDGIYSIGRYGSWTYCSIEDNIIEARELINKLF